MTPFSAHALWTRSTTASIAGPAAAGSRSRISSRPRTTTKPAVTWRCSLSTVCARCPARRCGSAWAAMCSRAAGSALACGTASHDGRPSSGWPACCRAPTSGGSSARAVSGATRICPAVASPSHAQTVVAVGPTTISPRCGVPGAANSSGPNATPRLIDSLARPKPVDAWRNGHSAPWRSFAAAAARASCPGSRKPTINASPPKPRMSPPSACAAPPRRSMMRSMSVMRASVPSRPCLARRSDSAVKPETSATRIDPSVCVRLVRCSAISSSRISGT